MTKKYLRVIIGAKSVHASDCFEGNFAGVDFMANEDFTGKFLPTHREFNKKFIPKYLEQRPEKSKVAAGLACACIHYFCHDMRIDDTVISPDGNGNYRFGRVSGDYIYKRNEILPHQRPVEWLDLAIPWSSFSQEFQNSAG